PRFYRRRTDRSTRHRTRNDRRLPSILGGFRQSMMPPLKQAMGARIIPFFEKVTETFSYLVIDSPAQAAAIIDPVLDYDPAAGRIRTHSADAIAKMSQAEGLRVEWILETHFHVDHLSAAGYLK